MPASVGQPSAEQQPVKVSLKTVLNAVLVGAAFLFVAVMLFI
jgi:hypothetical protein